MGYTIEQWPKNKDFDISKMSFDQMSLRVNAKVRKYGKEITCKKCNKTQPIAEFYIKDKKTGRRATQCRDCHMKSIGVVEIGKQRFAFKIAAKGFRRCSVCKEIKPLTQYHKVKTQYLGIANNCCECSAKLYSKWFKHQKETIGISYVQEYGKRIGVKKFTKKIIEKLRAEIVNSRSPHYFVDGLEFVTVRDFARYIEVNYGVRVQATEARIRSGKNEEDCKLSESETRSIAYTQGEIKVSDSITGKVFVFKNSNDPELLKMFSKSAITHAIQTKKKTRVTKLSKYVNPSCY